MRKNKGIRSDLRGLAGSLKGVVLLVCLLVPDYTSADCQCYLYPFVRQRRELFIENYAQQYIHNFTANVTTDLLYQSKSTYNLTAKLATYVGNQSLGRFTLLGGLYNISADKLASDNLLWLYSLTAATYNCQGENVNMSTYITRCYFQTLEKQLEELATNWSYPLGVYKSSLMRSFNYVSTDFLAKSICFCSTNSGFSYHIHLEIDPQNLPALYYNRSLIIGKLTERDVELAVDNATSILFGETYVHSELQTWASPNSSVLCLLLYFKGQYDLWWNSEFSYANNTLGRMTGLDLEYLQTRLLIVSKPIIRACTSYSNGTSRPCPTLSTVTTTNVSLTNTPITIPLKVSDPTTHQNNVATNTTYPSTTLSTDSTPKLFNTTSTSTENTSPPSTVSSTTAVTTSDSPKLATTQFLNTTNSRTTTTSPLTTTLTSTNLSTPNGTLPQTDTTVLTETTPFSQSISESTITSTLSNPTTIPTSQTFSNSPTKASTKVPASTTSIQPTSGTGLSTPFDDDPFFKAEVPVLKKIYNDKILLNRFGGTAQETALTEQVFLYTIAIPAALGTFAILFLKRDLIFVCVGILTCSILCLVCCQMDWIGLLGSKKNQD